MPFMVKSRSKVATKFRAFSVFSGQTLPSSTVPQTLCVKTCSKVAPSPDKAYDKAFFDNDTEGV